MAASQTAPEDRSVPGVNPSAAQESAMKEAEDVLPPPGPCPGSVSSDAGAGDERAQQEVTPPPVRDVPPTGDDVGARGSMVTRLPSRGSMATTSAVLTMEAAAAREDVRVLKSIAEV